MRNHHVRSHRKSFFALTLGLTLLGGLSAPFTPVAEAQAVLPMAGVLVTASASTAPVPSSAVELSPTPPNDTQAVAPNIVVTFDDSGSMASNFMGDKRPFDNGSWSGPWRCAGVIDPRITDKANILASAMNGVYYNPTVRYTPPVKADGTSFANADASLVRVPQDGIGVNRPYNQKTLASSGGYYNNPNGSTDTTSATNLTGTVTYSLPTITTKYVTFGTTASCPSNADAGTCSDHKSNNNQTNYRYFIANQDGSTTGTSGGTIYYGKNLDWDNRSHSGWTTVVGDTTSATSRYVTWSVTTTDSSGTPVPSNDNRWTCGYGTSPMDGKTAGPDGVTYPNGGPYYYRYKTTSPTITTDAYGRPDAAGLGNLYNSANWEAVAVTNTDVTINDVTVNQWQNFANWYAYYRTRNLMTRTSLSRVFGGLGASTPTGAFGNTFRVAWQNLYTYDTFHLQSDTIITSLLDLNSPAKCDPTSLDPSTVSLQSTTPLKSAPNCYRSAFFNWIFGVDATGGTPARASAIRAGEFFRRGYDTTTKTGNTGATGDLHDPYWEAPKDTKADGIELVCRQNFHMLVTDGYWNESDPTLPSPFYDSQTDIKLPDGTQYSATAAESRVYWNVQGTKYTSSQANIAFNYWAQNLRPDLYDPANGKIVPPYMPDTNVGVVSGATSDALEKYFNPKNDPANWPHMVEYMVTLGVPGNLTYSNDVDCTNPSDNDICALRRGEKNSTGAVGWTTPANNSAPGIDDTWHAAVNSRGAYFNAGNPQILVDQLSTILTNINARNAPASTGAVNTSVLVPGALGFSTSYSSADWSGTLQAVGVNADGTITTTPLWKAGDLLDKATASARKIFTAKESATDGTFAGGVDFKTYSDLDTAGQTLLSGSPASVDATNDTGQTRIDYLRGDRSKEGTTFRKRPTLLGAIIGSQPVYVSYPSSGYRNSWPAGSPEQTAIDTDASTCSTTKTCSSYEYFVNNHLSRTPTVYVGANDGMLHAFNAAEETVSGVVQPTAAAGTELFAYVPRATYANLGNLTVKDNFQFLPTVDGIPVTRDVFFGAATTTPTATSKGWHTILVGGLRLGGRGVYALDITDPSSMSASKVLWEFTADQADQGAWTDGTISNPGGKPSNLGYTFGQPNIGRLNDGKWVVLVPAGYFPDCSKPPYTASNCSYPAAASNKFSSLFVLDAQTGKLIRELTTPDPATVTGAVASHGLSSPVLGDYNDDQIDDVAFAGDLDGNLWRYDLTSSDPSKWTISLAYQPATAGAQPITSMPRLFGDPATNKFIVVFGTGKFLGVSDNTSGSAAVQAVYGIRDKGTTVQFTDLVQQTLSEKLATDGLTLARGLTNEPVPAAKGGWYFNLGPSASSAGERVVVTPGALFDTGRAVIQTLIPGTNDPCSATIQGALMVINAATGGSDGGLSGPDVAGWGGSNPGDTSTVGGRVNDPRTSGSVPLVSTVGGGTILIPGLKLSGSGGVLNINDAIWRRRSWRALNNDQ